MNREEGTLSLKENQERNLSQQELFSNGNSEFEGTNLPQAEQEIEVSTLEERPSATQKHVDITTEKNFPIIGNNNQKILNRDLVEFMGKKTSPSVKMTSANQKNFLLDFVCTQLGKDQKSLLDHVVKDLKQAIAIFFTSFNALYKSSKIEYKKDRLFADKWCSLSFHIPKSAIGSSPGIEIEDTELSGLEDCSDFDTSDIDDNDQSSEHFMIGNSETDQIDHSESFVTSRLELVTMMRNNPFAFRDKQNQLESLRDSILSKLPYSVEELEDFIPDLDIEITRFLDDVCRRYTISRRNFNHMIFKNKKKPRHYFTTTFELPPSILEYHETFQFRQVNDLKPTGRKLLPFAQKSKRAKQYASAEVRKSFEAEAIIFATAQQPTDLGRLVRKSNSARGITVKKALDAISKPSKDPISKKTPSQALAFLLTNNLSKSQYNEMKSACTESNANIWPNYNMLLAAKAECRPDEIKFDSLSVQVPLQNLLNHSVKRILLQDPEIVEKLKELAAQQNNQLTLLLYFKYGLDGCGSFDSYMQKDVNGKVPDGSTLLSSQMVPLQIVVHNHTTTILFNNPSPNSANACRPIRLCFERETKETIRKESSRLMEEVENLQELILMDNPKISILFRGLLTMIDGKILNELTKNPAASSCPICHKTSRQMSNPDGDFTPKDGTDIFGASILHFGLRSFESILQIGYCQDVKKSHEVYTVEERKLIAERKKKVQAEFKSKLGLIVDQRRDGGAGNTNTGNLVRVALDNPAITAEICAVPEQLVKNLKTIWNVMASGYAINVDAFSQLCKETEAIYFDEHTGVGWYNICPTLHKILNHGKDIISKCALPIGLTSEEASEANNKILRHVRLFHSRKSSWANHLSDLFHRIMDVSDPVISEIASKKKTKRARAKQPLSPEIVALLQSPLLPITANENYSSGESDSDGDT
jgi:hypothetical protein